MRISDWSSDVCSSDLLRLHRHVADLVEEQRAAGRLLETPRSTGLRAGKGAAFMAEQLGFDQFARNRGHVDRNEGCMAARPEIVARPRHQFLAGARFARHQYRPIFPNDPRNYPVDLLHRLLTADTPPPSLFLPPHSTGNPP